jgi:cytosine/adenosine deaminase-related metal-dependent hydrolase
VALCPRFVPSVTPAFFEEICGRADWARFPIHTHGSETRHEVEETRRLTGETPPVYLAGLRGAFGRVKMAHGVWLDDRDREHLARSAVAVLHCPGSNFKLGSGLADVSAMRRAGITVGLGADGAACNNRLDPWSEMRLAAHVQSLQHGPEAVRPPDILRMATLDGARALGLDEQVGSLRAGKRADFTVIDPSADAAGLAGCSSLEDPAAALVFAGEPAWVRETWIDGRRCHPAGDEAFDRDRAERVRRATALLADRAGLPPPERPPAGDGGG